MFDDEWIEIEWVEGSTKPIEIACGKILDDGTIAYGTTNGFNLTDPTKDIYVQVFDLENNSATPVMNKNRVAGVKSTGFELDEDSNTKTDIAITPTSADYATFNTNGVNVHYYELRAKFKQSMYAQEIPLIPYEAQHSGRIVRVRIKLIPKKITS